MGGQPAGDNRTNPDLLISPFAFGRAIRRFNPTFQGAGNHCLTGMIPKIQPLGQLAGRLGALLVSVGNAEFLHISIQLYHLSNFISLKR
jgi:hypothetical protein